MVNILIAVLVTGPSNTVYCGPGAPLLPWYLQWHPCETEGKGAGETQGAASKHDLDRDMLPAVTVLSCYGWNKGLKQDWREVLIRAWHQGLSNITKTGTSVNPCNSLLDLFHCLFPPINTLFDSVGLKKFRDFRNREKKMVLSTEEERMSCIFWGFTWGLRRKTFTI